MANRTAVTGNWTATAGTNTAFGGVTTTAAGDELTIPTGVTVTVPSANSVVARSLTIANGGTLIFSATTSVISLGDATAGTGNVALSIGTTATITLTALGVINYISTSATQQTITTGGKTMPTMTINGVGSSYVLGGSLTMPAATLTLTNGTFATANFAITCNILSVSTGTKVFTPGSSAISCASGAASVNFSAGLTITNNTATITQTGAAATFNCVIGANFNGLSLVQSGSGAAGVNQSCILANYTRTGTAVKTDSLVMNGNMICTGTFTCTGNSIINRMSLTVTTPGTQMAIVAGTYAVTFTDVMDIVVANNTSTTVITSDSFNRANGSLGGSTTDIAAGGTAKVWSAPTLGTWNISSNQIQTTLTAFNAAITVDAGVRDVRVEAKVVNLGASGTTSWMLAAAFVDGNNFTFVRVSQAGAIGIGYVQNSSSTYSTLTGVTVVAGDTVGIEQIGPATIARLNGVVVGVSILSSSLNSLFNGTRVGLAGTNNSAVLVQFDDFKVSNCSTALNLADGGDCLGNSNITFPASVNRYAVAPGNWSSTAMWSATSGGSAGASVPLPQDNVFFNASSAAGTYSLDMPRMGANIDYTGFTRTFTIPNTLAVSQYGSLTLSTGMTWTSPSNSAYYFRGRGTHTITTAAKTWRDGGNGTIIAAPGGSYSLLDDWSGASFFLQVLQGTFTTNNFNIVTDSFQTTGNSTRVVNLGTSTITLSYTTFWVVSGLAFTLNASAATLILAPVNTGGTRSFTGAGLAYGTLRYTYVSQFAYNQLNIGGNNYFDTLEVGPGKPLMFTAASLNTIKNFIATGVSNGYLYLQSTAGNYATVPDSPALSWTGDFDLRVRVNPLAWASSNMHFAGKRTNATTGYSWYWGLNAATKQQQLVISANGTTLSTTNSSVALGFSDGTAGWLRVTRRASDGRVQFFTAADNASMPSSWTQLGIDKTATIGALFDSPAGIAMGAADTAVTPTFTGSYYRFQARDNILDNGTGIQLDADFSTKPLCADTFTEASSNAATVTITGATAKSGDGRVPVGSITAASAAYLELVGPVDSVDYQTVQDIFSTIPYKYYAGAHSVSVSNNTNVIFTAATVGPYIYRQAETTTGSGTTHTATFPFSGTATAGNLLVACFSALNNPGVVTTPAGWTLIDSVNSSLSATTYTYYKIASGGETGVTVSYTISDFPMFKVLEISGFTGTPVLHVKDKNSAASNTTISTNGTNPITTVSPAIAIAFFGFGNTPNATVSISNSFQESRLLLTSTGLRTFGKLLTSNAQVNSTYVWTSARFSTAQLVVFCSLSLAGGRNLPMLGVGS